MRFLLDFQCSIYFKIKAFAKVFRLKSPLNVFSYRILL
jgi:hypothetical protein